MMSVAALKWAIALRDVGHREKCVLLVLSWHANSRTQKCNPSTRTIAAEAGMSRNTVDLALEELHRLGLVESKVSPRRDAATRYLLNLDSEIIDSGGSTGRPRRGSTGEPRRGSDAEPHRGSDRTAGVAQPVSQKGNRKGTVSDETVPADVIRLRIRGGSNA